MKNFPYFDIFFIIIISCILLIIYILGYSNLLSQFSVIIAIVSYFIGKYFGKIELRNKQEEDNS